MDVASLKAHMKSNTIPHILIFGGDEWEVQKIYIQQIENTTKLERRRIDAVVDILPALRNKSFTNKEYLYVVRDDKEYMANEKLQERVTSNIGNNILIFIVTKLDKRLKFYNRNKDTIVEFETLPEPLLRKYIQKQIPLSDKNCQTLIELCESNYGRILLEIDKIRNWREAYIKDKEEPIPYDGAFLRLVHDDIIYKPAQDVIFILVAAILQRKKKSFALLQESYDSGEATMVMLTVLFNTAKSVLQVQTCKSNKIAESTGLTGFQIMKAKEVMGHYTEKELIRMLHLIRKVESGIKTGRIDDVFAMQYLLVNVL